MKPRPSPPVCAHDLGMVDTVGVRGSIPRGPTKKAEVNQAVTFQGEPPFSCPETLPGSKVKAKVKSRNAPQAGAPGRFSFAGLA